MNKNKDIKEPNAKKFQAIAVYVLDLTKLITGFTSSYIPVKNSRHLFANNIEYRNLAM